MPISGRTMTPLLEIEDLNVRYGAITALRGVSLAVEPGEVVAILGPNGAGKSSLMMSVAGVVPPSSGTVKLRGESIVGWQPEKIARSGMALVPERRRVFPELTVEENLKVAALVCGRNEGRRQVESAMEQFPILSDRKSQRADQLSGGEQQQLAIARACVTRPELMLVDEPSLGLAPKMIDSVYELLEQQRREGVAVLLVEQNVTRAAGIADRTFLLDNGVMTLAGGDGDASKIDVTELYLGKVQEKP